MRSNAVLFFVIILAVCLTQFASDIYAPSLPNIADTLNTHVDLAQWSMAIYMLGVALSQLVYGPLSEGIGRKTPLLAGLAIMLVGSLFCLFAPGIDALIWGRLIQGCGAGACAALWRSIFRDVFTGEDLAKYGSYLVIFIMFIVPAAPALGGYLQDWSGWRATFAFMSIYGLVAFLAILLGYKETSQHHHVERLKLSFVSKTYSSLLSSPVFMGVTVCTFLSYGAFFAWFVTGPVLLIEGIGISPVAFGWITFLGGGGAYALAGWLNGKVVKRFGMPNMLRFGWSVMIGSGLSMLIGQFVYGQNLWVDRRPCDPLLFWVHIYLAERFCDRVHPLWQNRWIRRGSLRFHANQRSRGDWRADVLFIRRIAAFTWLGYARSFPRLVDSL